MGLTALRCRHGAQGSGWALKSFSVIWQANAGVKACIFVKIPAWGFQKSSGPAKLFVFH
jgi:hypothetical protein